MSEIVAVPSPSAAIPGTDGDAPSALDLSTSAVAALIEEAELTPKPALVDRRGNGAHHDLDLERLRLSARALRDGFAAIARAASGEEPSLRLREQLGRIGREMERRMLAATDGSNAHRGAIWALGLLVAAAAQRRSDRASGQHRGNGGRSARLPDRFAPRPLSNGERVRLRFGATGARGEAQAGFPHAILVGLPTLRAARPRGTRRLRATRCAHGHHGQPRRYLPAPSRRSCRARDGEGGRLGRARRGRDGLAGRAATPAPAA